MHEKKNGNKLKIPAEMDREMQLNLKWNWKCGKKNRVKTGLYEEKYEFYISEQANFFMIVMMLRTNLVSNDSTYDSIM